MLIRGKLKWSDPEVKAVDVRIGKAVLGDGAQVR